MDLSRIVGFDWDDGNARKSLDKHAVSQREAEEAFADPRVLVAPDSKHSAAESRFHALGTAASGRLLLVTFTLREEGRKLRVISARPANRRERTIYDQDA